MAKIIDQNEGSKFRTMENDGFGASKTKNLSKRVKKIKLSITAK